MHLGPDIEPQTHAVEGEIADLPAAFGLVKKELEIDTSLFGMGYERFNHPSLSPFASIFDGHVEPTKKLRRLRVCDLGKESPKKIDKTLSAPPIEIFPGLSERTLGEVLEIKHGVSPPDNALVFRLLSRGERLSFLCPLEVLNRRDESSDDLHRRLLLRLLGGDRKSDPKNQRDACRACHACAEPKLGRRPFRVYSGPPPSVGSHARGHLSLRRTMLSTLAMLLTKRRCTARPPFRRLGVLALAFFLLAAKDTDALERVSLKEALRWAETAHPDLAQDRAALRSAEADLARARAGRYPRGEFRSVFGIVNGAEVGEVPSGLPEELAPLFSEDDADDPLNNLGPFVQNTLTLTVPLYTFGKIGNGVEAAASGVEARENDMARRAVSLQVELKRIFYGYQLATALLDTFREVEANFKNAALRAEERLEEGEGEVSQADVLKLQVAAQGIGRRVLRLARQRQVSLLAFRRAVGRPLEAPIVPAGDDIRPVEVDLPNEESLVALVTDLPALRAAEAGLQAKEASVRRAESQLFPDFFLGVRAEVNWAENRDNIRNPFLLDPFNLIRGGPFLGLRWELDIAAKLALKKKAEAELEEQRARVAQARVGLPLAIRRAYLSYEEKRQALELSTKSRKAGRALSFLSAANLRIGIGEPAAILEAYGLYARTAGEYAESVFAYNMAVAELAAAVGKPLERELL